MDEQNRSAAIRWARQGNAGSALQALAPAGIAEPSPATAAAIAEATRAAPERGAGPAGVERTQPR
eukprot:15437507-Alexandrium_andersonii.AAC.1